jgi:hypothetical protein
MIFRLSRPTTTPPIPAQMCAHYRPVLRAQLVIWIYRLMEASPAARTGRLRRRCRELAAAMDGAVGGPGRTGEGTTSGRAMHCFVGTRGESGRQVGPGCNTARVPCCSPAVSYLRVLRRSARTARAFSRCSGVGAMSAVIAVVVMVALYKAAATADPSCRDWRMSMSPVRLGGLGLVA